MVDVLIIPIGDHGYTLDGAGALELVKKIEPKIVIPTHYADKAIKYEVPQAELGEALKGLGMEPSETLDRYKIRPGELGDRIALGYTRASVGRKFRGALFSLGCE